MKTKRIIFFCGTLMQGGAERVISVLSKKFVERKLDVTILYYYDSEVFYDIHPDVKVVCVEKKSGSKSKLKNLLWIRKFFKKNADIIISFMATLNIFSLVAHNGLKMPIIVADRSDPWIVPRNLIVRKFRDFIYNFADGVVLQTRRNYEYFSKSIKKKSTVIYNPIDVGDYEGLALKTSKVKKIVSVGRLVESKNHKMLIDAFSYVVQKHPDYRLVIYGDGPMKEKLGEQVFNLGLNEKVFLPGNEKDIFQKILDSELFVLSSNYEGMPNALIEAMCLGLPVISTSVSGATDVIKDQVNGFLINSNNLSQLINAIDKMLNNDEFRVNCATNATKLAESVKTDVVVDKWLTLINNF